MKATMRDLRYRSKAIMDAVDRGETVLITRRGKVAARMLPASEAATDSNENPFIGMWKDRPEMADVSNYTRTLRKRRTF